MFGNVLNKTDRFQHTAARRRLAAADTADLILKLFQHTAARRRLAGMPMSAFIPKSFNTQPPEGGWKQDCNRYGKVRRFNTQPPEGGWLTVVLDKALYIQFQHTAARRRLGLPFLTCKSVA